MQLAIKRYVVYQVVEHVETVALFLQNVNTYTQVARMGSPTSSLGYGQTTSCLYA